MLPKKTLVLAASFAFLTVVASAQDAPVHFPTSSTSVAPSAPAAAPAPSKPDTYGTTAISYSRVPHTDFLPADSATTWSDLSQTSFNFSRFPTANSGTAFVASPHLPSGASIVAIELDYCDTNATTDVQMNIYSSSYDGSGATQIGTVSSSGSSGCGFISTTLASPFTIDNNQNQVTLVAFVGATDGSLGISGAIMRYLLQVSPAPGMATFPDVPTSDFGFQYVEALAASGITGGCGGGNYCPDSFVTRRQMAIFIAKALGLHWQ